MFDKQDDWDLIAAAKGDPEKFTALYDKYLTPIYRYFMARVSHRETAEDLTSQTFLQAFNAFGGFDAKNKTFAPWLFTIAHNVLVNSYRKKPSLPLSSSFDIPSTAEQSVEKITDGVISVEYLRQLVKALEDRDQEIVRLRTGDDLSFDQIGEVLGITETAARTAYHRAVQKLISIHRENLNVTI